MKSLSCYIKSHFCKGMASLNKPCACECHARHIAPTLDELKEKRHQPFSEQTTPFSKRWK